MTYFWFTPPPSKMHQMKIDRPMLYSMHDMIWAWIAIKFQKEAPVSYIWFTTHLSLNTHLLTKSDGPRPHKVQASTDQAWKYYTSQCERCDLNTILSMLNYSRKPQSPGFSLHKKVVLYKLVVDVKGPRIAFGFLFFPVRVELPLLPFGLLFVSYWTNL